MVDVQLSEIQKSFGRRKVISGLNLHVDAGQYVVLLGTSGCGKSTLLKITAGLIGCDAGRVSIGGSDVTRLPPRRRDVSIVFQHDAMYPHLSIRESIAFGMAKTVGSKELQARVDAACVITGASELLDRRPANLSGGELRRAAMTKAIVRRAGVRLLDEPLSALDAPVRHGIQNALLDWHNDTPGTTIHVTHDGQVAMAVADRIAVMQDGKIMQFAEPTEIYRQPASKQVALAIGSPPMNFLRGEAKAGELSIDHADVRTHGLSCSLPASVDVGIRADCFRLLDCPESIIEPGLTFNAQVKRLEPSESRMLAHVHCGGENLVVVVDAGQVVPDSPVKLFVASENLHLFDANSGARLSFRPTGYST